VPVRSPRLLAAAIAAAAAALPASDAAAERTARERAIRVGAIAGAMALYVAHETLAKDALSPDTCRWCSPGGLDRFFRERVVWDDPDQARSLSNVIGYATSPIAGTLLMLVASEDAGPGRWTAFADDITAVFELVWGTQLVNQYVKSIAGRARPYAHYGMEPGTQEDNLSFFSGHSSLTFSIAVGAGVLAQRRGYRLAPVIWSTGLALAAATAYLRMAADRHYFTDVLVGGAVGAAGAVLIPRLTGSLPARAAVVPQPNGVALVGSF
jgi:membrane-associated phospholipid phosphatase